MFAFRLWSGSPLGVGRSPFSPPGNAGTLCTALTHASDRWLGSARAEVTVAELRGGSPSDPRICSAVLPRHFCRRRSVTCQQLAPS